MAWNFTIDEKTFSVPGQTMPFGHPQIVMINLFLML